MGIAETKNRHDVPSHRFDFDGYNVWHSDRGGQDKVALFNFRRVLLTLFVCQGGGGLSLYYDKKLKTHEYSPSLPPQFSYLERERQWLLIESKGSKIDFLR